MKKLSSVIHIAQWSVYLDLRDSVDRIPYMALQISSMLDSVNTLKFRIRATLKEEIA